MDWNEVTTITIEGNVLSVKDAMIMLSEDEETPESPSIDCEPGEFILEINVPFPFHAHRARIRKIDSEPELGKEIGQVDVDHGFIGFIDYEKLLAAAKKDYSEYEEWTATELDDELSLNFSGMIDFETAALLYVKSGDGDGTYPCYELVENGARVGIECVFKA